MRVAVEHIVDSGNLNYLSENAYDSTKWNLGRGIIYNNGISPNDKYLSPDFSAIRPMEESTPFAVAQIAAYNLNTTTSYIFGVENATTASNTRRIALWQINRKTGTKSWQGFITLTLGSATAHTVRDFKVDIKNESTGTVAVTGTALTGSGTAFATNKVAVGARIGFGSTDPGQITTWYRITARGSDTALTLNLTPGTIPALTPYVIQEFRPIYIATNATTTNGGVHYAKGVSIEDFMIAGTTIPLGAATDDLKAVYWLKDAATVTNLVAAGCAVDFDAATPTSLNAYVLDLVSAGNYKVYKYNLRAALTVASGISTSAWILTTGNNAFTGTGSQNANCTYANASHGSGSGIPSIYFVSTTRVMRASLTNITSGNVSWISDTIIEIPPGGVSTFSVTATLNTIEYMDSIDSFAISATSTAVPIFYLTKFVSSGQQFDLQFGRNQAYNEQSAKDNDHPTVFNVAAPAVAFTNAGGNRLFVVKQGTTALNSQIYILSAIADWFYSTQNNDRLITPELPITNTLKFYKVVPETVSYLGGINIGKQTEPIRVFARTTNITIDATSGWTLLDSTFDLSVIGAASSIQFAIEFRTLGDTCLPARLLGLDIIYEDNTGDSHYAFSSDKSSAASKRFAWWFKTAFGGTVPTLTIRLYNAVTGGLLLTDDTAAHTLGTFEKSIDGGVSWIAYDSVDRANDITYIRYTPTTLADNVNVEAYITQG